MARRAQRHRSTVLPFRYVDDGIDFSVEAYSLDGRKPQEVNLKPGERSVDIAPAPPSHSTESESPSDHWTRATIFGTLEVGEDVFEIVFPPEERDAPPAKLYVAVRCHETIYRDRADVTDSPDESEVYEASVKLPWDQIRGVVELRPYLVRTAESDAEGPFATARNVRVASGDRYEIIVDHWDADEPAAIDGEEASFARSDNLPNGEKLYHLDFRNEARPKLWINADHPRITDILQTGGSVGAEPRLRDVILDQISYGVWTQLIVRTAAAVDREGNVEYEWQRNVLESFARDLYDVTDVSDAAHFLREEVSEPEGFARLVGRIDHELQEFIDPRSQLINLMEEGLRL